VQSEDYSALREYSQLPIERKLPFSLVFMVDGFWGLSHKQRIPNKWNSLRNQARYLFDNLHQGEQRFEDPLGMFQMTIGDLSSPSEKRLDFFKQQSGSRTGYKCRIDPKDKGIDRMT
jgi:hypothetical protein